MARRRSKRSRKFYEEQLEYWDEKLKNHFKENVTQDFDADKRFEILAQMEEQGMKVDWEAYYKQVEASQDIVFPIVIQHAFVVWNYLTPNWEGMGGTYLGRFMQGVQEIMNLLEIEDQKIVLEFVQKIDSYFAKEVNDKAEKKRKEMERKNSVRKK